MLAHEIGHTLGLVDNGVPMVQDHEDPDHANHTADPECIMYWAYERRAAVKKLEQVLDSGTPEEAIGFCPPSLNDLEQFKAG